MENQSIDITELKLKNDYRGYIVNVPEEVFDFIVNIKDIHIGSIASNSIRGNHYHKIKKEALIIIYSDSCTFAWNSKDEIINIKEFTGKGCILVKIKNGLGHAIKNTGKDLITIVAFSDYKFVEENPDTFSKVLIN